MNKIKLSAITSVIVLLITAGCDSISDSDISETDTIISNEAVSTQNISGTNVYTIYPGNPQGWGFAAEGGDGTGSFVNGPDTPPYGSGSANFILDSNDDSAILGKADYLGKRLDEITVLQYSTYRSSGGAAQAPALQFNIDNDLTDADVNWKGRLVFEPYYTETVLTGEWQTWDALSQGKWWGSGAPINSVCPIGSPCTWTELLTAFPDAGVHSTLGAVLFKAGSGWTSFDGNVDGFVIGDANGSDTYDFELEAPSPQTKDDCKEGEWEEFGFRNQGQCIQYVNTGKDNR